MVNIKHCWKNHPVNIGHFVHDVLFYGLVAYIEDNSVKWVLDNDLSNWEYQITKPDNPAPTTITLYFSMSI
jgi:hypothetical protein